MIVKAGLHPYGLYPYRSFMDEALTSVGVIKLLHAVKTPMIEALIDAPSLLANRYRVVQTLGEGGFGTTYLAADTQLPSQRQCVVKQLKPIEHEPQIHQLVLERFQREAAVLESLGNGSDQIPTLYAYFTEEDSFYIVQEWFEGDTLTQKVNKEGLFSESAVRQLLMSLLSVLDYMHQNNVVHRDIKPTNIIYRWCDGKPALIDFGAVKETMGTSLHDPRTRSIAVGTPGFMPSEQISGRPMYSSDLYSLGMTAIYLLTGKMPQNLDTDLQTGACLWQQWAPGISPSLIAILDKAIQILPRDRFSTAQEMLTAVQSTADAALSEPYPTALQPTHLVAAVSTLPEYASTIAKAPGQITETQLLPLTTLLPSVGISDGKKAVLAGGIVGACLLGATLVAQSLLPSPKTAGIPQTRLQTVPTPVMTSAAKAKPPIKTAAKAKTVGSSVGGTVGRTGYKFVRTSTSAPAKTAGMRYSSPAKPVVSRAAAPAPPPAPAALPRTPSASKPTVRKPVRKAVKPASRRVQRVNRARPSGGAGKRRKVRAVRQQPSFQIQLAPRPRVTYERKVRRSEVREKVRVKPVRAKKGRGKGKD
jgi:serine/threonine protein kinase, bacterial